MNNFFNEEQIRYIYSDDGFFEFINNYFSSYKLNIKNINQNLHDKKQCDIERNIYLRIILLKLEELKKYMTRIERNLSYTYKDESKDIEGEIRGKLLLNEYIRNKPMQTMPKTYPCRIKGKSYINDENEYLIYILYDVLNELENLMNLFKQDYNNYSSITEVNLLNDFILYFRNFINKSILKEVNELVRSYILRGYSFSEDKKNNIQNKLRKGRVRNGKNYCEIFDWYSRYLNLGLCNVKIQNLEFLVYDEKFSNKLFELWILYKIKDIFVNEFKLKLIDDNDLMISNDNPIFIIKTINGKYIKIFYQKGKFLLWNDNIQSKWSYVKDGNKKPLKAIPDIVLKYSDTLDSADGSIILLDVKNKIRKNGYNSEEIYKMLGYYENFGHFFRYQFGQDFAYNSILVFRNDDIGFNESLITESNDHILGVSVSPSEKIELNNEQFILICRHILDIFNNEGITTEIIGQFHGNVHQVRSIDNKEVQLLNISRMNHDKILKVFRDEKLKLELEEIGIKLERDHFPHLWYKLDKDTRLILSMAESLFLKIEKIDNVDYSAICLEYCKAIEIELNKVLINDFRFNYTYSNNRVYSRLGEDRELTLGEIAFLISNAKRNAYEFKNYIKENFKNESEILNNGYNNLSTINTKYRIPSAHVEILGYNVLEECRQKILGIGCKSILYIFTGTKKEF